MTACGDDGDRRHLRTWCPLDGASVNGLLLRSCQDRVPRGPGHCASHQQDVSETAPVKQLEGAEQSPVPGTTDESDLHLGDGERQDSGLHQGSDSSSESASDRPGLTPGGESGARSIERDGCHFHSRAWAWAWSSGLARLEDQAEACHAQFHEGPSGATAVEALVECANEARSSSAWKAQSDQNWYGKYALEHHAASPVASDHARRGRDMSRQDCRSGGLSRGSVRVEA